MTASGSNPAMLSKVVHLQKALADSGMAKHEIANALTLAMAMANSETKESLQDLIKHFADVLGGEVTEEEVQMLLAMAEAMSNGEMPEEVVRWMLVIKKLQKFWEGVSSNTQWREHSDQSMLLEIQ